MFELIRENRRKAATLVAVMAVLLLLIGFALGELAGQGAGGFGVLLAFVIWVALAVGSYYAGDQVLLTVSGARRIEKDDHPVLFDVVEEMTIASGSGRIPAVYIIDDEAPNAFATGRDVQHASVAVTSGLLKLLSRDELQGVIAHEMSHITNRDTLYLTMVSVMMGTIVLLADAGRRSLFFGSRSRTSSRRRGGGQGEAILLVLAILLIIVAPIIARLIYLAISRRREYLADACGAQYSRYPEALASALEKLGASTARLHTATQATAPLFIVNPLRITAQGLADLTSTHPPISERIRILRSMGGMAGVANYDEAFRRVTGRPVGVVPLAAIHAQAAVPALVPALAASAPETKMDRVRQTTDALWRLQNYTFIACPCGTNLKIPSAYVGKRIECPHCSTVHTVGPAAA